MSQVDWENAPDWADRYIFSQLSGNRYFSDGKHVFTSGEKVVIVHNDTFLIEMRPDEWTKGAQIMEQIAQNGNGGEVYDELENNKSKYHREIKKGVFVDVYDVLSAFEVVNPAMQHALKKMLAPGKRGAKDTIQDMKEAIQSIERAIELEKEKGE